MSAPVNTADFAAALRVRDRAGINRIAGKLLDQRTKLGSEWLSVAEVLAATGEFSLALAAAERGIEESGGAPRTQLQHANLLATMGRHDEAIALMQQIPRGQFNVVERDHFIGTCALEIGEFDSARKAFNRVVAAWPPAGATWLSLAALPAENDAELLERLDKARTEVMRSVPSDRAQYYYARGTLLDRLGRADEAFAAFASGAQIVKAMRPYDKQADLADAAGLAREWSGEAIASAGEQVEIATARPILVIGLPRSGTTLVEQILVSHSAVAGGGELPFSGILAREIGGNSVGKLEAFAAANGADALGRLYLHLGDERFGESARFVDKNVDNSRTLGLLASVLPEAPIVWLRRDPLDCAWSCFRTYFTEGLEWSWSLADIAEHFRAEERLYEHWREALGGRLLTVSYEALVADPESEAARILAHAGLAPEAAVGGAHKTRRAVVTASVAQVRQPVYQSSVGSAQRYLGHLKPFLDAYAATTSAG